MQDPCLECDQPRHPDATQTVTSCRETSLTLARILLRASARMRIHVRLVVRMHTIHQLTIHPLTIRLRITHYRTIHQRTMHPRIIR